MYTMYMTYNLRLYNVEYSGTHISSFHHGSSLTTLLPNLFSQWERLSSRAYYSRDLSVIQSRKTLVISPLLFPQPKPDLKIVKFYLH